MAFDPELGKYRSDGSRLGHLLEWLDARFPLSAWWRKNLTEYYVPKNLNVWYVFGVLALVVLGIQMISGLFLAMHYQPDAALNGDGIPVAFASVERIMRKVPWGWLLRYLHATGASAFFAVIYLHIFRALLYGSYRKPRELVWLIGMGCFMLLMAEAFFGYLLPWGQMSYWGAQVIVNLFSTVPLVGTDLANWVRGDLAVGGATLNRFFALHVIGVPLLLLGLVRLHIVAVREVGSSNPDGVEINRHQDAAGRPLDGVPFHPYQTVKDFVAVVGFLTLFSVIVFFLPDGGGLILEANNFYPADPLKTPAHIAPVWYFAPFYSILRAVVWNLFWLPAKFWGGVALVASVLLIGLLPWLDRSPVSSIRQRGPVFKTLLTLLVVDFFLLGYLGTQAPSSAGTWLAQSGALYYFAFFLTMPWWSRIDSCQPVPERIPGRQGGGS